MTIPTAQSAPRIPQDLDWQPIKSGNLVQVGHDAKTNHLYVEFNPNKNGRSVYRYPDVTAAQYDGLRTAPSAGGYLHEHIKTKMRPIAAGLPDTGAKVYAHPAERVDHTS